MQDRQERLDNERLDKRDLSVLAECFKVPRGCRLMLSGSFFTKLDQKEE